jgi:hypothetical protein
MESFASAEKREFYRYCPDVIHWEEQRIGREEEEAWDEVASSTSTKIQVFNLNPAKPAQEAWVQG